MKTIAFYWNRKEGAIMAVSALAIAMCLTMRYGLGLSSPVYEWPLVVGMLAGIPLIGDIILKLRRGEFGSDVLAAISIITSFILHQYLAGAIVVLMLSGGAVLEAYAVRSASSVLQALAKRMPKLAHRKQGDQLIDLPVEKIAVGDHVVIYPHEISPVDGIVVEGHGVMDESFLTGEPFRIAKTPGTGVYSGAINGDTALTIEATKAAENSRYAKITEIMRAAEEKRPRIRRLGDTLGAVYTPAALAVAGIAWLVSHDPSRFLAVLVVATPCPLIIAIPIAVIGSISLCARRSIIVKNPVALEQIQACRTAIYDKTGTLTYGEPALVEQQHDSPHAPREILAWAASLERYSKHPLAHAILKAAEKEEIGLLQASKLSEKPGEGLRGHIDGHEISIVSRNHPMVKTFLQQQPLMSSGGLECFILVDGAYAAVYRFRDKPRSEGSSFVNHMGPRHSFERQVIVSGDRESEVRYLAEQVGITEIYAGQSPEQKLALVRAETAKAKTLFIGDGINDAPALLAATVGIAVGQGSDVTSEAASVVVLDNSLRHVDEFMHISERMRRIALQSAIGGMVLSLGGMLLAAFGFLPPVAGAVAQEAIDLMAILNALRAAWPPSVLSDFDAH